MADTQTRHTNSSFFYLCVFLACIQNEAVTALKKTRQQYFQRCDELEKAKAISAKALDDTAGTKTVDKRRKSKDEAQIKVNVPLMHYCMICRNRVLAQFSTGEILYNVI